MASALPTTDARRIARALRLPDQLAIWGGLGALSALAWLYLWRMPAGAMAMACSMAGMAGMAAMPGMSMASPWSPGQLWLTFLMWAVMMVAMMLPSAAPMVAMYARVAEGRGTSPRVRVWLFAGGYVAAWTAFSAVATVLQAALDHAAMLTGAMRVAPLMGGVILALAGAYQLSPLKRGCLRHCQSPIGLPDVALARRPYRRDRDGAAPWRVLRGMLLDADGVAVRRGCDEPAVGGSADGFRADRAGDAMGRDAGDRFGLRAYRRRPRAGRAQLILLLILCVGDA